MIAAHAAAQSSSLELIVVLACVLVASVSGAVTLTWSRAPWWRRFPSPRRQLDDDRDHLKAWRMRRRHPDAFADYPMPAPPQPPPSKGEGDA